MSCTSSTSNQNTGSTETQKILGEVKLEEHNTIIAGEKSWYEKHIFTDCGDAKPQTLTINAKIMSKEWHIGFFNTDTVVQFDRIEIQEQAQFSSVVRNYVCNGKSGTEKTEKYYSLINSVKTLDITGVNMQFLSDLADYVEGKYQVGEHWQLCNINKSAKIKINEIDQATLWRLKAYFSDVTCYCITCNLKNQNEIVHDCDEYRFTNCDSKEIDPSQLKLIIGSHIKYIKFTNTSDQGVFFSEIFIKEKGQIESILQNEWYGKNNAKEQFNPYSLLLHVGTLTIENNPYFICDLADYVDSAEYKINKLRFFFMGMKAGQFNSETRIRINNVKQAFSVNVINKISRIKRRFNDVVVNDYKGFFNEYNLQTELMSQFLEMEQKDQKINLTGSLYNVISNSSQINQLVVNQILEDNQFICFHNTNKPPSVNTIIIGNNGNIRNVLQNAYYNNEQGGFFSLLQTAKVLQITNNPHALKDILDYVEGKYILNQNWKIIALDRNIKIKIKCQKNDIPTVYKLQKYFNAVQHDVQAVILVQNFWKDNAVQMDCDICYFIDCQNITPRSIFINGKVTQKIVGFCDTYHEVHIPHITIASLGEFSSIVCNFNSWNNKEQNYYSLINHVETLTIEENNQVVSDLAKYMKDQYDLDKRWKYEAVPRDRWKYGVVPRDVKITINNYSGCAIVLNFLLNNINEVIVNGSPGIQYVTEYKNAFQEHITQHYKGLELKDIACSTQFSKQLELLPDIYHITECNVQINQLVVQLQVNENQFICFHGSEQEPKINKIVIDENGCLRTVLQNMLWCNEQSKLFSLLACCEVLTIWDNSRALKDLADYVERRYQLNGYWECESIDKTVKLETSATGDDIPVIKKLKIRFGSVFIRDLSISIQATTIIDEPCEKCTFIQEKHTQSNGTQKLSLIIDADVSDDIIMSNREIKFSNVTIGPHGKLDNIIYNGYDRDNNLIRYSILSNVEVLTIRDNQDALKYFAMYINKKYRLIQGWSIKELSEDAYICIQHARIQNETEINQIKSHFRRVAVSGIKTQLANQNTIDTAFISCTFTNCRNAEPKTLSVNALLRDNIIRFIQADDVICIQKIEIGGNGSLQSVIHNEWGEDERQLAEFSLLAFAKELTIINNQQAIKDLLAYITEYEGKSKAMRPNKNMWVRIIGSELNDEINKLADYFGLVAVDNTIVLSNDKNEAKESINRRNQYLKETHKQIDDKRGEIFNKEMMIKKQIEKAKQRYRRRRLRFQEYLALAE